MLELLRIPALAALVPLLLVVGCLECPPQAMSELPEECRATTPEPVWSDAGFHAARDCPPDGWTGPIFHLATDYPTTEPQGRLPWDGIDYRQKPERYLETLLTYALDDDNLPIDREETGEVPQDGPWYHAPWLNYGVYGREFVHGLTRERTSRPGELHPLQKDRFQNWAVSVFNARGGYSLGRIWADRERPALDGSFLPGTYAVKFLFTEASVEQVPYLRGAPVWRAHIHRGWDRKWPGNLEREVKLVRLLQVDLAVKHGDGPTGWVFGTFIYHRAVQHREPWRRLLPVGLAWGNGIGDAGGAGKEFWLNPRADDLLLAPLRGRDLRAEFGYRGRLNGMVDDARSSCLSCHATAQVTTHTFAQQYGSTPKEANFGVDLLTPPDGAGGTEAAAWFKNVMAGQPFTPDWEVVRIPGISKAKLEAENLQPTDYSLQVMFGIENFRSHCSEMRACPETPGVPAGTAAALAETGADGENGLRSLAADGEFVPEEEPVTMDDTAMEKFRNARPPLAREGRQ